MGLAGLGSICSLELQGRKGCSPIPYPLPHESSLGRSFYLGPGGLRSMSESTGLALTRWAEVEAQPSYYSQRTWGGRFQRSGF